MPGWGRGGGVQGISRLGDEENRERQRREVGRQAKPQMDVLLRPCCVF